MLRSHCDITKRRFSTARLHNQKTTILDCASIELNLYIYIYIYARLHHTGESKLGAKAKTRRLMLLPLMLLMITH